MEGKTHGCAHSDVNTVSDFFQVLIYGEEITPLHMSANDTVREQDFCQTVDLYIPNEVIPDV